MDDLDRKILSLLAKNARMPVKEIAEQVSLTSPAVSSRIHKLETDGIISGYTVTLNRPADRMYVDALISLSVAPSKQDAFLELLQSSNAVLPRHGCIHLPCQGELRQHAPAGTPDPAVPEAGYHQHPDHPFYAGEPRRAGCPYAVTLFIKWLHLRCNSAGLFFRIMDSRRKTAHNSFKTAAPAFTRRFSHTKGFHL